MERLTERDEFGNADIIGVDSAEISRNLNYKEFNLVTDALNKLAEYEDAEEQGMLLRLPVAIGSTLYQNRRGNIVELKTIGVIYDILSKEWLYEVAVERGLDWVKTVCSMECIGKTVFLTREEAEQALKQMGE